MLKEAFSNMEIKRYKSEAGVPVSDVLEFIYEALQAGYSAAVPVDNLAFMRQNPLCMPLDCGEYAGCYLFKRHCGKYCRAPLIDRVISLVLIFLLLPLFLLITGVVFFIDGPPVLFSQQRFGLNNASFKIYKFRTMLSRSEKMQPKMQARWGQRGRLFKMDNDPRVTRLGGLLRKTFLDELPQLFNVVQGEMRLIGARPLPVSDEHHYERESQRLRQRGVPGVTGLWQVSGRNELTFDEMCLLDYYYYCNRSWMLDLKIILRTAKIVLHAGL